MPSINYRFTKNRKRPNSNGTNSTDNSRLPLYLKAFEFGKDVLFNPAKSLYVMSALLPIELFLNLFIIFKVKYTEIDWIAYMQEVEGFINGTLNYYELKGDTGPLVYPAGFVYIYTVLYAITSKGINVKLAQFIFVFLYLIFMTSVFYVYSRTKKVPPICYIIMCLMSHRIHSIFVLRLFNDPIAMLFLYVSIGFMLNGWWRAACVFFSFGVSIKMNVLLYAPGLFILLVLSNGIYNTIGLIILCGVIQLLLGAPFLTTYPIAYLHRAFEFSRQFFYIWTVNWKCIPEDVFLSRKFQLTLLFLHLFMLFIFMNKYLKNFGGLKGLWHRRNMRTKLSTDFIITVMFLSNFIGITFSRSLHYQFYVWYYHSFAYLLWNTPYPNVVKFLIFGLLELCWNVYPSIAASSILLHSCHLSVLGGLWWTFSQSNIKQNDS